MGDRHFTIELWPGQGPTLRVMYEKVRKLKVIKKTSYRTKGRPDPWLVRQAVDGLGVDTHVMVRLPDETILRGHIQAIDERRFTLRLDASGDLTPIPYDQVLQVRENSHEELAMILIPIIAAVAALVVLLVVLVRKKSGDEPFVSTIAPNTIQAGQDVNVRITGNNFAAGATVKFKKGDGAKPMASNVVVIDANTLTATVTVNVPGPSRNRVWNVVVTNSGGKSGKLKDAFTVTP